MDRKILSVFIASPSDLNEERETLRMVTERLNKIYGKRISWQIELLGWEDTLAGVGRPQEFINKDVETCDLFIGMLWKRWGTSTSTNSGKYSSGFEEEFDIARNRNLTTGKPEIWLLFKKVDEDLCKDLGPQLKKVLDFKHEQIEKKELLYKEFEDTGQFERLTNDDLSKYLLDLYKSSLTSKGLDTGTPSTTYQTTEEAKPHDKLLGENKQVVELYSTISQKLREGNEKEIPYWDRLRSHLSSSAFFSDVHLGEIFGVHETNLVYKKRKSWKLAFYERWFLIRTYFGNTTNNFPGWFWINKDDDMSTVGASLVFLAVHDKNNDVRIGAIGALYDINFSPKLPFLKLLLDKEENDKIIFNSICLSRNCDDKGVLELLKQLFEHSNNNIKEQALNAYIDILYKYEPEESFMLLIEKSSFVTNDYKSYLDNKNLKVSKELLIKATKEGNPRIREYSSKYLYQTKGLTKDIANSLLNDTDSHVRKIGFEWLINNGVQFSVKDVSKYFPKPKKGGKSLLTGLTGEVTEDEIRSLVLSKKSREELEELIDLYSMSGLDAYRTLAQLHTNNVVEMLRSDLSDELAKIKEKSIERLNNDHGTDGAQLFIQKYGADLHKYVIDSFITVALTGLAKCAETNDIKIARKYLGKTKHGMGDTAAINIILNFGNDSDVESLLEFAKEAHADGKRKAINAAISLCKDKESLIKQLVLCDDRVISSEAALQIEALEKNSRLELAKTLLNSENDDVRITAAKTISKTVSEDQVEILLDKYIENKRYYYNVVNYFDRFIYAPNSFKSITKGEVLNL